MSLRGAMQFSVIILHMSLQSQARSMQQDNNMALTLTRQTSSATVNVLLLKLLPQHVGASQTIIVHPTGSWTEVVVVLDRTGQCRTRTACTLVLRESLSGHWSPFGT